MVLQPPLVCASPRHRPSSLMPNMNDSIGRGNINCDPAPFRSMGPQDLPNLLLRTCIPMNPHGLALHILCWLWTPRQGIGVGTGIHASKPLKSATSVVRCSSIQIRETVRACSRMPVLLEERMNSSRSATSLGRSRANIKPRQGTIHVVAKHRNGMDNSYAACLGF